MAAKINYYKKSLKEISLLPIGNKPTLLLHSCCGPCACFPLKFLDQYFKVTIFFYNSNIYPETEYNRRLEELKKLLVYYEQDFNIKVDLIVLPYDHEKYMEPLRKYCNQKEGQERCFECYEKRMSLAYDYAEENGYDFFTTVMTISRQKDSQKLNEIGLKLQAKHFKTKYFLSDFKKNRGIDIGQDIAKSYSLYRQLYCGCEYSLAESQVKHKE